MRIALLGMSGVGKTYWSTKLEDTGFQAFHCDDMIATHLQTELGKADGDVYDLGDWMGFPYETGFREKEAKYLACERQVLQEIITYLSDDNNPDQNLVVDLTGSAIYAGLSVFEHLQQYLTIVYLAIPVSVRDQMLSTYLASPRPVVWQDSFQLKTGESETAALSRCYPQLIAFREKLYQDFCDVQLDYQLHRQTPLSTTAFLQKIECLAPKPST